MKVKAGHWNFGTCSASIAFCHMRFRSFGRRFFLFSQTTLFIVNVIIGARRGDKRQKELVEKYNRLADCRMIHNDGNFQVDKKCTGWGSRTVCTCLEDLCNCDKCEVSPSLKSSGLAPELNVMSLSFLFMALVLHTVDNFQTGVDRYHHVHHVLRSH